MVSEPVIDRGTQQDSASPFVLDEDLSQSGCPCRKSQLGNVVERSLIGEQSVTVSGYRSLYKHWIGTPVAGSRGRGAIRLSDAVGAEVQSECGLFQAAGLLSDELSVGPGRGGSRGYGRKAKLNERGDKIRSEMSSSLMTTGGSTDRVAQY